MKEHDETQGDLTPAEAALLASLTNPDAPRPAVLDYDEARAALALMLQDAGFLKMGAGLVRPAYFADEAQEVLARLALELWREYNEPPTKSVLLRSGGGMSLTTPWL